MNGDAIGELRVRSVPWRDLTRLSRLEIAHELIFPLPWLAVSLYCASQNWYPLALVGSFYFFLAGLRQVHNAFHLAIGVSREACEWIMFVLSVLMLGSMHAVQVNHLRHHKHCMADGDVEGQSARMPAWKALLTGPLFPLRMHMAAIIYARRSQRRWIAAELAANVVWVAAVFWILDSQFLRFHLLAMATGQCLAAFFCVWTVHHDCHSSNVVARTVRSRWKNAITLSMFYHNEHHLFPAVPTCHLSLLADRLDRATPAWDSKEQTKVF